MAMDPAASDGVPPANPVLRYMAILSAAGDFGISAADIERVAARFDPRTADPRELADALVGEGQAATPGISSTPW
jgi:hypothetical protein